MAATGQRESRPLKGIRYGAASAVTIELAPLIAPLKCDSAPNRDPARDWSYHIDLMLIISVMVGSLSAPIGTPLVQGILDVESRWQPALERGPSSVLIHTAERARGYKPDGTLFRYLIANAGVAVPEILHSGQSQHTDMVGGKPLGLTVTWINRRNLELHPSVPKPDYVFPDRKSLLSLLAGSNEGGGHGRDRT
jgi:hypothetical protein